MANTLLTTDKILRESLRVLHAKLNFIGRVNRSYDSSFAQSGAKIGDTLRIRLPAQYEVTDGAVLTAQDTVEKNTSLAITSRKHVGAKFTDEELQMDIDSFSELHLEPAMSVLAAKAESDMINSVYKQVYNQVNNVASDMTYKLIGNGRKLLVDNLVPQDNTVTACLNTSDNLDLNDALKGLFNPQSTIGANFREGGIGRTSGYSFFENTHMPRHTTGTDDGTGDYLTDSATAQTGASLTIDTGAGTMTAGDVFTVAGVNRVHPETKVDTGNLQQFVVTTAIGASATTITFTPEIIATGPYQNVSNGAANNQALTKVGGNAAAHDVSLGFHRDAFAFATADLPVPGGMDMAGRKVMDGISMRFVRGFDIVNSRFVSRFDITYGFNAIRPELAHRWANN